MVNKSQEKIWRINYKLCLFNLKVSIKKRYCIKFILLIILIKYELESALKNSEQAKNFNLVMSDHLIIESHSSWFNYLLIYAYCQALSIINRVQI